MSDQADQTIIIRYILEAQDTITKAQEIDAQVLKIKTDLMSMSASSGASFKSLATAMQQTAKVDFNQQIASLKAAGQPIQQATQDYNQLSQSITKAQTAAQQQAQSSTQSVQQLGTAAQDAKGGFTALAVGIAAAFGISVINIIRNFFQSFINLCKEAIDLAYNFSKSLFVLQTNINFMRRTGIDIGISDVTKQIDLWQQKFGVFSKVTLVDFSAKLLTMVRNLGLSKDQIASLGDAILSTSIATGRSAETITDAYVKALEGTVRPAKEFGIVISQHQVYLEALRLGYHGTAAAMDEQTVALATLNLLLPQTAQYSKDVLEYQKQLPGKIDATDAKIADVTKSTGENLLVLKLAWENLKFGVVGGIGTIIQYVGGLKDAEQKAADEEEKILGHRLNIWETFITKLKASQDWAANVINSIFYGKPLPTEQQIPEAPIGAVTPTPALNQDQIDAANKTAQDILDLQEQYDNDRRDLATDLQRDLVKIEADGAAKLEDIQASHAQKMLDIANKATDDISNAEAKYALDIQQAWDDYYSNVADAAQKDSDKLLKIEEDHQEKLKRLKEGFLMDMEDALQKRDARQVLQLIRRYNLEKTQATRERDQNIKDENRAYQEQLKTLDRQRNDRLKKLKQELDLREAQIIKQRDRELALEVESFNHKMAQQEVENKADIDARKLKYKQDLEDLDTHLQDRIRKLADGLVKEGTITAQGMQGILDIIVAYIGPGGAAEKVYDYFVKYAQAAMAAAMGVGSVQTQKQYKETYVPKKSKGGIEVYNPQHESYANGGMVITRPPKSYATGGMEIANKPTTAVFGDAGPELHLFIPLTGNVSNLSAGKAPLPTMKTGAGGKGKLQVEVLLEAGLVGKIVDKAHNEMADVIFGSVKR